MAAVLNPQAASQQFVGLFRTFGPAGPAYQVRKPLHTLANGDWLMEIEVLESGEVLEYKASKITSDPAAI